MSEKLFLQACTAVLDDTIRKDYGLATCEGCLCRFPTPTDHVCLMDKSWIPQSRQTQLEIVQQGIVLLKNFIFFDTLFIS